MIKGWENDQRFLRDDFSFDAFDHLAHKLGHKNSSTLRKMCGPDSSRCGAKLGFNDALVLMSEMNDYRLLEYMKSELNNRKKECEQMNLIFSKPHTEL